MRNVRLIALLLVALLAIGGLSVATAHEGPEFRVELSGDQEVPARDTEASGEARFRFRDSDHLEFRLEVEDIENVRAAHIHCGARDVNGPVVVTLFPTKFGLVDAGLGEFEGRIAEGTITNDDVTVRPSSTECPGGVANFAELTAKMLSGDTYVNVHTDDGVDPANTGAGDFPGGEIRAQLEEED